VNDRGENQGYPKPSEWVVKERQASDFGFLDVLAFLIPATSFIEVKIIGRLLGPDMLLAAMIPFLLLLRKHREVELVDRFCRTFIMFAGIWFFGQVITDLIRQTPFEDWSRGWSKILFTMVNFWSLWMLLDGRPRRIVLFSIGLALGDVLTYFFNRSEYAVFYPWKFGYGIAASMSILLLATAIYRQSFSRRMLAFIILGGIGLVNLLMGFRSLGTLLFMTALFLIISSSIKQIDRNFRPLRKLKVAFFIMIVSISGLTAYGLYSTLAEGGFLGEQARDLYETQNQGVYGLLGGGRSEILSSAIAIKDSPILGHGSWAKNCQYTDILIEMKRKLGYVAGAENDDCLIPSHSIIMGAWVEAGILGAFVWVWVGLVTVKVLNSVYQKDVKLAPLVVFYAFALIWNLIFSPFASFMRYTVPFHFVTIIAAIDWIQKENNDSRLRK